MRRLAGRTHNAGMDEPAESFTDEEYAFLRHVRFGELPPRVGPDERRRVHRDRAAPGPARARPAAPTSGTCASARVADDADGPRAGTHGPSHGTDQKTGTPSRTSRQFGTKKSAGSITPLACAQSISSWRISCCCVVDLGLHDAGEVAAAAAPVVVHRDHELVVVGDRGVGAGHGPGG